MLRLTSKGAVRFSWADDVMEATFTLAPGDSQEELVGKLQRMLDFVQARQTPLPERIPGFALGMAQTAHPAPVQATGNGWASTPVIPPRLEGEVEMIPPEEQG